MATLTPTTLTNAGIDETATMVSASTCGDKFRALSSRDYIRVTNAAASTRTVTIANQQQGGSNIVVTLDTLTNAPDNDKIIAFPSIDEFIDEDGYVNISYSAVTSVTVGVFRRP
jgi:hypothetical protein